MRTLMIALMFLVGVWPNSQSQSVWKEFVSQAGRFSANMPADVKTNTLATHTSDGLLLTHTSSSTDTDLNEYLVSWTEYQQNSIEQRATEKTFNKMRDALVEFKGGKVLSESPVGGTGYPARAATFSTSEGRVVQVRFYFVKNRFYQVMAETNKAESGAVEKFFASFKLLPGTPI